MLTFIRYPRRGMNSPAKTRSTLKHTKNSELTAVCLSRLPFSDTEFIRWRLLPVRLDHLCPAARPACLNEGDGCIFHDRLLFLLLRKRKIMRNKTKIIPCCTQIFQPKSCLNQVIPAMTTKVAKTQRATVRITFESFINHPPAHLPLANLPLAYFFKSPKICVAASLPGAPMTQPPGCVPEPHW